MKEEIKLLYDANHNYREGYEQALKDMKAQRVEDQTDAVGRFIAELGEMAESNWTAIYCQMLQWLIGATLTGMNYAEYAEAHMMDNLKKDD